MRAGRLSVILAAAVLTGCTHVVSGTGAARSSLPVAGFPATAGLTEIAAKTFYRRSGNREYGFNFATPNGFACGMGSFPKWESARVHCTGPRPDKGPGTWTVTAKRFGQTTIKLTSKRERPRSSRARAGRKELPQQHYVVDSADTLCLVTQDSVVACHVGEHGFILAPDKTTLF